MEVYDEAIEIHLGVKDSNIDIFGRIIQEKYLLNIYIECKVFFGEYTSMIEGKYLKNAYEVLCYDDKEYDFFGIGLRIRHNDEASAEYSTVNRRSVVKDVQKLCTANNNSLLNTRQYEVHYAGDEIESITDNMIAENLLDQVDKEGNIKMMMRKIIDRESVIMIFSKDWGLPQQRVVYYIRTGIIKGGRYVSNGKMVSLTGCP